MTPNEYQWGFVAVRFFNWPIHKLITAVSRGGVLIQGGPYPSFYLRHFLLCKYKSKFLGKAYFSAHEVVLS